MLKLSQSIANAISEHVGEEFLTGEFIQFNEFLKKCIDSLDQIEVKVEEEDLEEQEMMRKAAVNVWKDYFKYPYNHV